MKRDGGMRDGLIVIALVAGAVFLWHFLPALTKTHATPGPAASLVAVHSPTASSTPSTGVSNGITLPYATTTGVLIPVDHVYVEVVDSCGPYYQGDCINMRAGPGTQYPSVLKLRNGMVLGVTGVMADEEGNQWYMIDPGRDVRYAERITSDWFIRADLVRAFTDTSEGELQPGEHVKTGKRIVVSKSKQMLYAYDGDTLFMQESISTGLDSTPTPLGTFIVFRKTPSRYMQGPIPGVSDQVYDLPGVPWNLYFTNDGAVIHGAYWHNHFGEPWSHGCVNLPPAKAKALYEWAELGMKVTIEA